MNSSADYEIESWEGEGGASQGPRAGSMTGTASQVDWTERIKRLVNRKFDRVTRSFRSAAPKPTGSRRANTQADSAILEKQRAEVVRTSEAGYWQQISDQVRQMIFRDARYRAIKGKRLQNDWRPRAS